jgi:hypothetical protein
VSGRRCMRCTVSVHWCVTFRVQWRSVHGVVDPCETQEGKSVRGNRKESPVTWAVEPTWRQGRLAAKAERGKQHVREGGVRRNRQAARPSRPGWYGESRIA